MFVVCVCLLSSIVVFSGGSVSCEVVSVLGSLCLSVSRSANLLFVLDVVHVLHLFCYGRRSSPCFFMSLSLCVCVSVCLDVFCRLFFSLPVGLDVFRNVSVNRLVFLTFCK